MAQTDSERTGGLGPVVPRKPPPVPQKADEFRPHPTRPGWSIDGRGRLRTPDMASDAAQREAAINRKNGTVEPDYDDWFGWTDQYGVPTAEQRCKEMLKVSLEILGTDLRTMYQEICGLENRAFHRRHQ